MEPGISRVGVKAPPFWPEEPELWFAQMERQFALSGIVRDDTKYAHALAYIDTRHAKEVKDVITQPSEHDKYETLKKAVIQRLTSS